MEINSFQNIPENWTPLNNFIALMIRNVNRNPKTLPYHKVERIQKFNNFLSQYETTVGEKIAIPEQLERTELFQNAQDLTNIDDFFNEILKSDQFVEIQNLKKIETSVKNLIINDLAPPDNFILQLEQSEEIPKGWTEWDTWKRNKIKFGKNEIYFKELKGIKEIEKL